MSEDIFNLLFLVIIIGGKICGAQKCTFGHEAINCKNVVGRFTSLYEDYMLDDYVTFDCQQCHLEEFNTETFPFRNDLEEFNISHSNLKRIGSEAFKYFNKLRYLNLEANNITSIAPQAFYELTELRELHLENNNLQTLNESVFDGASVWFINLSHNNLVCLPAGVFKSTASVSKLDISHNKIKEIDSDFLKYIHDLEILDLSYNELVHLSLGMFRWTRHIRTLDLCNNKLKSIDLGIFSSLQKLKRLYLGNNSLSVFDSKLLLSTPDLTDLDISGNGIIALDIDELILNAPKLRTIFLEENMFECAYLAKTIQKLTNKEIEIEVNVERYEYQNIAGIVCVYERNQFDVISLNTFIDKVKSQSQAPVSSCQV